MVARVKRIAGVSTTREAVNIALDHYARSSDNSQILALFGTGGVAAPAHIRIGMFRSDSSCARVLAIGDEIPDGPTVVTRARQRGVLIFAFGPRTIRAVTHLDVSRQECERAADVLLAIVEEEAVLPELR